MYADITDILCQLSHVFVYSQFLQCCYTLSK
jgi:hypothetical protein